MRQEARTCVELGVLLGIHKTHNLEDIKGGIRKYYEEHGTRPGTTSGDATLYVGYGTNWDTASQWLRNHGHGSLPELCEKLGLGRWDHNLEKIQRGVRKYHEENGGCPTKKSEGAAPYVGFQVTWGALDQWLRGNGHGSLPQLCRGMGFRPYRAQHDLKGIKSGIQKYYKEHGKLPQRDAGDATRYVGYQTTWAAVGSWLSKGPTPSFSQLCQEMGFEAHFAVHDVQKIEEGIRKYHQEHEERPSMVSGDATPYVGYNTRWPTIHSWLCKNGHGTLRKLGTEMGFRELRSAGRLEREAQEIQEFVVCGSVVNEDLKGRRTFMGVRLKIQGFFDTHGCRPVQKDFRNDDAWLRKRGSSLGSICAAMGLPKKPVRQEGEVRREVRAYWKKHGKRPVAGRSPLSDPEERRMKSLDTWLRNNGHGSLYQLCMSMGIK